MAARWSTGAGDDGALVVPEVTAHRMAIPGSVLAALIALASVGAAGMLGTHLYTFFWDTIGTSI